MKAKITQNNVSNARNYSNEKEEVDRLVLIGCKKGEHKELVTARFWYSKSRTASVCYCSIWVNCSPVYVSGKGQAGGWGYHRSSAALESALTSAGIELYGSPYLGPGEKPREGKENFKSRAYIGGCGDTAMQDAIKAIGVALGYTTKQLHLVR